MIPPQLWSILIQAAIPLGAELVTDIVLLIKKEATAPLTAADWDALSEKWGKKTAAGYLADALAKSGAA